MIRSKEMIYKQIGMVLVLILICSLLACTRKADDEQSEGSTVQEESTTQEESTVQQDQDMEQEDSEISNNAMDVEQSDNDWPAPTNEGLADTTWDCPGWSLELRWGDGGQDYAGVFELYHQTEVGQEYQLYNSGCWRMENDCLRLEVSEEEGSGSFPVSIDPSGEHLYIQQDPEGIKPPFFNEDQMSVELVLIYG